MHRCDRTEADVLVDDTPWRLDTVTQYCALATRLGGRSGVVWVDERATLERLITVAQMPGVSRQAVPKAAWERLMVLRPT